MITLFQIKSLKVMYIFLQMYFLTLGETEVEELTNLTSRSLAAPNSCPSRAFPPSCTAPRRAATGGAPGRVPAPLTLALPALG